MATYPVEIPFRLTEAEVVLEPMPAPPDPWKWIREELEQSSFPGVDGVNSDEMERIFRAAVILYQRLQRDDKARYRKSDPRTMTTFEQCLETAIIWERG